MLTLLPLTLKQANQYVAQYHRHNKPVPGAKFSLGVVNGKKLCGVAIVGRPVARHSDNGFTLEVNRVATDGTFNTCSMLYGAARRVAFAMGYQKIIIYTLQSESGSSLRAVGWTCVAEVPGLSRGWMNREGRHFQEVVLQPKYRWESINPHFISICSQQNISW